MGIPQFMPSSYRKYAVDFNGNNKIDLLREDEDAIGSVANYMRGYGWLGKPEARPPIAAQASVIQQGWVGEMGKPRTLKEWSLLGVAPGVNLPADLSARLTSYSAKNGKEYWLVFNNFEVITRYNNSDYYAMCVFQLAQELEAARKTTAAN
jgi:membrane-bound lytic murein transglycosylase B